MIQKIAKWIKDIFIVEVVKRKGFTISFDRKDIDEKKLFSNKECFTEFMVMFKNDYIERITNRDYSGAEVVKDILERLLAMFEAFNIDQEPKESRLPTDIISTLQEKMSEEGKRAGQ